MKPLAYALWLAMQEKPRAEVMRGIAQALPGGLGDKDLLPGQPLRAGGYAEDRPLYTQQLFAPHGEEPRTVHLGLDIFAPANAEVFAPFDGRIHSFQDNANAGDYGPTIILEHDAGGELFHTLYGHLSRASLDGLAPRKVIAAGERFARLGAREENGGWPPHLHFQVLLDIGGDQGDYPGVCKRSEQDVWLAKCPDPWAFLGLPAPDGGA